MIEHQPDRIKNHNITLNTLFSLQHTQLLYFALVYIPTPWSALLLEHMSASVTPSIEESRPATWLHWWCREITWFCMRSAVRCCHGVASVWTIKTELLYMLWNQYKLATMRRNEFLCQQFTRIPNLANRNSDFLTFQKSEFQKKIRPEFLEFFFQWGSQKSEPNIGIPNQALQSIYNELLPLIQPPHCPILFPHHPR